MPHLASSRNIICDNQRHGAGNSDCLDLALALASISRSRPKRLEGLQAYSSQAYNSRFCKKRPTNAATRR